MGDRQNVLLNAAARAFDDQRSPFEGDWLGEHEVTADECFALSSNIGVLLHGYLASPKHEQHALALRGACRAAGMSSEIIDDAAAGLRLKHLGDLMQKGE